MVDYTFYQTVYLGSAVPEKAFPGMAARAQAELDRLKRTFRVSGGQESEKLALCAMADALWEHRGRGGVRSASLGGVQVSYDPGDALRAARRAAGIYLDIYRGKQ